MIENLRPLTQEQRQGAHQSAREAVLRAIGSKPVREHFAGETISRYPVSVTRLITFLCLILLLAAFTPSAIRLYVIGSLTFGQAVPNETAKQVVGLATVLSAEVGQVVFSLALATLGASRSSRRLLYSSMAITTCLALTGNIQVGLVGHTGSPFAWLEAMAPPIVVLSTAYVLKEQLLEAIEQRHTTERTYQTALNEWHKATAHPEAHPQWSQLYANALRDALSRANNRRQEILAALTTADWRALVYRELQTEHWFADPLEDVPEDQIVDNPHLDIEVEVGEMFVFGSPATAACFRWLIENRRNYSHFVDNRTSYTNDPIGVQLAYDLRHSLKEGYWAALPPDTLPAYLAIVQALQDANVPDAYQEGALPLLYTSQVATLPTDLLRIVQVGGDEIWLHGPDALVFDQQPVHVFVLEPDTGQAPAALILTTQAEPGNPERHRANPPVRYLDRSHETEQLAFVPRDQVERIRENINEAEDVLTDTLWGENHALDDESGIFCV